MRKSRVDLKSGEGLGNAILPDGRASMTYPVTGPAPSVLSDQWSVKADADFVTEVCKGEPGEPMKYKAYYSFLNNQ